jgi:hypothetical protein
LMFLVHPTLTEEEIRKTCVVLDAVMAQADAVSGLSAVQQRLTLTH